MDIKTLVINKSENFQSLEEKYYLLNSGENFKLRLPNSINTSGALGIETALLQLIGTWIQNGDFEKSIHTYCQDAEAENPDEFKELCSSLYGIGSLALADSIFSTGYKKISRRTALSAAVQTIENLRNKNFAESFKSRYFGIPCIRKKGYDREYDVPLYNGIKVVEQDAFSKIIYKILKSNIAGEGRFGRLDEQVKIIDLADMLWELFSNTNDHGRQDIHGNIIQVNQRSIAIQQQDVTKRYFDNWHSGVIGSSLETFWDLWAGLLTQKNLHVLDVSVTDFGVGFASLVSGKKISELSEEEELEITHRCFEENWSRTGRANRGSGLTRVLENVFRYKGFFRLRTGRVVVEKVYSQDSESWQIGKNDIRYLGTPVSGSAFHICIPLIRHNTIYKNFIKDDANAEF